MFAVITTIPKGNLSIRHSDPQIGIRALIDHTQQYLEGSLPSSHSDPQIGIKNLHLSTFDDLILGPMTQRNLNFEKKVTLIYPWYYRRMVTTYYINLRHSYWPPVMWQIDLKDDLNWTQIFFLWSKLVHRRRYTQTVVWFPTSCWGGSKCRFHWNKEYFTNTYSNMYFQVPSEL